MSLSDHSSHKTLKAVGWVKDAHHLRGDLYVELFAGRADWIAQLQKFYLSFKDRPQEKTELTCVKAKPHKKGLIIQTAELKDRTQAEAFRKATFEIPAAYLISTPGESVYLQELLGFLVRDQSGERGKVVGFSSNGVQDLLEVQSARDGSKPFLIPFVETFITNLDMENGVIEMDLPEGLEE